MNMVLKKLTHLFLFILPFSCLSQDLSVMTYNIRLDIKSDGVNQWDNRKEKVYDLILKYSPDIFGVQEALPNQVTDLDKNVDGYRYIGVGRDDGKQKGEYSAIFFKENLFDLLDNNTFWLSETPDVPGSKSWDAAITRVATWAKLRHKASGKEFLVMNTHFDHIGKEARKQSAGMIKQQAEKLANGQPVIITGDFNITRDEEPYSVLMNETGLKLNDPAPKENPPGTFCNFGVDSMPCRAIDYVFYSNHFTHENYQVLYDNDGKYYPSDHVPVLVKVSLKK